MLMAMLGLGVCAGCISTPSGTYMQQESNDFNSLNHVIQAYSGPDASQAQNEWQSWGERIDAAGGTATTQPTTAP
jgi:hypothetical protein